MHQTIHTYVRQRVAVVAAGKPFLRHRTFIIAAGCVGLLVLILLLAPSFREPTKSYTSVVRLRVPTFANGQVTATAKLRPGCDYTYGCWSYIKLERQGTLTDRLSGNQWKYSSGHWASSPNESVSAELVGGNCAVYRVTTESYYRMPAKPINLGIISLDTDKETKLWRTVTSTPATEVCAK